MNLRSDAVLELDRSDAPNGTGVFTLQNVEQTHELQREMLIGNRGQVISGLSDIAPFAPDLLGDGAGVDIDVGQGNDSQSFDFEVVPNPSQSDFRWGDGSGDSQFDLPDGHQQDMAELLQEYVRVSNTGSANPARLYWGPFDDSTHGPGGLFGKPFRCIVLDLTTTPADHDEPSAFTGTISLRRTNSFPDVDVDIDTPDY